MKNKIVKAAKDKGYEIEFEGNSNFNIIQEDVVYYYKCFLHKVSLAKIYTEQAPVTDIKVRDNIGRITVTVIEEDECEVALEDTIIEANNQGKEIEIKENIRFVCSPEFTLQSISQDDIVSQMGKADKNYNNITKNYMSSDRLREIYEKGKEVEKEIVLGLD